MQKYQKAQQSFEERTKQEHDARKILEQQAREAQAHCRQVEDQLKAQKDEFDKDMSQVRAEKSDTENKYSLIYVQHTQKWRKTMG